MKFRTEINCDPNTAMISYSDRLEMIGSCFVENISRKMVESGFQVDVNPFGIVYNPLSVSSCVRRLLESKDYSSQDVFEEKGIFHSFAHHSRFSGTDRETVLAGINSRIRHSSDFLQKADWLIITFGTAFVYRLKSTGEVVSNCHKLPSGLFFHERLQTAAVVSEWNVLIGQLRGMNPALKILFTVSPIRHWSGGAHENQLSKSILLLSIDEIIRENSACFYFPSYELMLDDLRDYRFYAEDMIHPSSQAVNYIWEKFSTCYFNKETKAKSAEWEQIQRDLNHQPFHPESDAYRLFRQNTAEKSKNFLRENRE